MSDATLAELGAVLRRPSLHRYFTRSRLTPTQFLDELRTQADLVTPVASAVPIRDERDRPFLEILGTHPPPQYLVTGDKDFEAHQYSGVPVISATLFAELLADT